MRKHNKAPLPFLGQKRNWLKVINDIDFSDKVVIDLFGGSGLLSHEIKRNNPTATVIWNDYDDYQSRINAIDDTESLRKQIASIGQHLNKGSRISDDVKLEILNTIRASSTQDFITVSSWLLFSGNYCHDLDSLVSKGWYFSVPKNELSAEDYLLGVERISCDFRDVLTRYQNTDNVIFVADPPYIMTNQQGYSVKNHKHFKLGDSIHLMKALNANQSILFSSTKSESDDLIEALGINVTERLSFMASPGAGNKYEDLLYKINF